MVDIANVLDKDHKDQSTILTKPDNKQKVKKKINRHQALAKGAKKERCLLTRVQALDAFNTINTTGNSVH